MGWRERIAAVDGCLTASGCVTARVTIEANLEGNYGTFDAIKEHRFYLSECGGIFRLHGRRGARRSPSETENTASQQSGCRVRGIDLTPEYIASAKKLTEITGLGDQISFDVNSALDMPFDNQSFDAAITIHVAMNIKDRPQLYREIARVMKPGATLCIFDVMKKGNEPLAFPAPWAASQETSYLVTPDEMSTFLDEAGIEIAELEDRTDFAFDFFRENAAAVTESGPPTLGIHLVMGESATEKLQNVVSNLERGCIAPVQIIATRSWD